MLQEHLIPVGESRKFYPNFNRNLVNQLRISEATAIVLLANPEEGKLIVLLENRVITNSGCRMAYNQLKFNNVMYDAEALVPCTAKETIC